MKIKLNCSLCSKEFLKENGEYNRRISKGQTNFYCSRNCGGSHQAALQNIGKNWGKQNHHLKRGGKTSDEYSSFREHLRRVRRRQHEYDITLSDLKTQWNSQNGKCVYTNVTLQLKKCNNPVYMASLDRIDSSKGYIKGNIQWISTVMNYAKSTMSHEQTLEFCKVVKNS
jgi:hypothetical protein